jgi:hypothetical protein
MPAEAEQMNKHLCRVDLKLSCVYILHSLAVGTRKLRSQKLCYKYTETEARSPSLQLQQAATRVPQCLAVQEERTNVTVINVQVRKRYLPPLTSSMS